ncbi:MAG: DNA repair protein RecO (recombination protein O) [Chlamydiales bacterium]
MAKFLDDGLVLRRSPFGESSLVVQVLTRRHGRVHFTAKGAYRPNSGYAFVLDLFHTISLEWSHSTRREMQYLSRADLAQRRESLCSRPDVYRAALMMLELTELAARPGAPDRALFELTEQGLDELSHLSPSTRGADHTLILFELRFLDHLGLSPALEQCAACGEPAPPLSLAPGRGALGARVGFSAAVGGRLCPRCATDARASGKRVGTLPTDVLDTAASIARGDRDDGNPQLLVRVRDAIERFLNYHLETRPRTQRAFLAVPNRNAP